jgi:hypothetical protein
MTKVLSQTREVARRSFGVNRTRDGKCRKPDTRERLRYIIGAAMALPALEHIRLVAVICAVALAPGCTTDGSQNELVLGHEGAPGVEIFLLLPMNVVITLVPELEDAAAILETEVAEFLRQNGRAVHELSFGEARSEWVAAAKEVTSRGWELSFDRNVAVFAERMLQSHDFDAMVMPAVIGRDIRVSGSFGRWDGVSRRFPTRNEPRLKPGQSGGVVGHGFAGTFMGASLHVMVFTRDGSRVFEGRGGLDFVHYADLSTALETWRWEIHRRDDFLEDPEIVREGIRLAFEPYLGPPGR